MSLPPKDAEHQTTRNDPIALYSQSIRDYTLSLYTDSLKLSKEQSGSGSAAEEPGRGQEEEKVQKEAPSPGNPLC
ncbi:hypothetical protein AX17_000873 [Amanita inopinata Kibby_2008]|nr:hypothetical protein AX17_000873 [Amanita inopinata Kibby_2008]